MYILKENKELKCNIKNTKNFLLTQEKAKNREGKKRHIKSKQLNGKAYPRPYRSLY